MIFPAIQTASRALPLGVGATSAAEMRRQLALLQAKWPVDATAYAVSFVIETGVAVLDLAQNALVAIRSVTTRASVFVGDTRRSIDSLGTVVLPVLNKAIIALAKDLRAAGIASREGQTAIVLPDFRDNVFAVLLNTITIQDTAEFIDEEIGLFTKFAVVAGLVFAAPGAVIAKTLEEVVEGIADLATRAGEGLLKATVGVGIIGLVAVGFIAAGWGLWRLTAGRDASESSPPVAGARRRRRR